MSEPSTESILSLGRISTSEEDGSELLQTAVNGWLDQLEFTKWPRGLQGFENASYLVGNHTTRFFQTSQGGLGAHTLGIHDKSKFDGLIAKISDNRLVRPVETVVSMLTQTRPTGRVRPNSNLPEDEDAADLAEIVLDLLWEKPLHMPSRIRELALLGCITGTSAIEIEFGETDVPVEIPKTKEVTEYDEFAEEKVTREVPDGTEVVYRKGVMARVWSSYHLTPDPAATNAHDMVWIARTTFEDIDWIAENFDREDEGYYPEKLEGMSSQHASRSVLFWYSKFQDILDSPHTTGYGLASSSYLTHGGSAPNQVLFSVIDVKPTLEHPRGRTLVVAGGQLIYAGDARSWSEEYPWRWHPYAFWGWFKLPGRFWHLPLLSELVPLQKKINVIDAIVHANRQFMGIGQWMLPKHSKVAEGSTGGKFGLNVGYTDVPGMSKPERVKHVGLPGELLEERALLIQAIDAIAASGIMDQMQISKSAARAGVMLDFIKQERLRSKSPMLQEFEECLETCAQNVLIETQLNMTEEDPEFTRRIQIAAREHSSLAVMSFVGQSLRDHHAVKIDIASQILKSPEAREAKASEAMQYLAQTLNPEERQGLMKAAGLGEFVKSEENDSVARARRLISRLVGGQIEDIRPETLQSLVMQGVDNARAMAPVFQREILSDRFNDHDPEIKKALFALLDIYRDLAAQAAEQEHQLALKRAMAQATVEAQAKASASPEQGSA